MRYLLRIGTLLISLCLYCADSIADVSYADLFLAGRGYRPVEDVWPGTDMLPDGTGENGIPDNPLYKEWCVKTFKNGGQIYEAYKEIAFTIDYRAEPPKMDYWQTPIETRQRKYGDCEDSVFLFFSDLSDREIDGDLVWGWVIDKKSSIAFAHVWYQLFDKHGSPYIVEGFSKEWNGIIPTEMFAETEERVPTLILRHSQVNHVADEMLPLFDGNEGREYFGSSREIQHPGRMYFDNRGIISEILQKLQNLFLRYRG